VSFKAKYASRAQPRYKHAKKYGVDCRGMCVSYFNRFWDNVAVLSYTYSSTVCYMCIFFSLAAKSLEGKVPPKS
jgi:hypothetical protein